MLDVGSNGRIGEVETSLSKDIGIIKGYLLDYVVPFYTIHVSLRYYACLRVLKMVKTLTLSLEPRSNITSLYC